MDCHPAQNLLVHHPPFPGSGFGEGRSTDDVDDLFLSGSLDNGAELDRHRLKNRAAQKRFRQRQKAKMENSAQQVAELSAQLEALTTVQEDLKARNRVLGNIVRLTNRQTAEIALLQEVQSQVQAVILQETTTLYQRALGRPELSQAEVCSGSVGTYMEQTFPELLARQKELLDNAGWTTATPSGHELSEVVCARVCKIIDSLHQLQDKRSEEARSALFSRWHHGVLAWNREEMSSIGQPPSTAFWDDLLAGMRLQPAQALSIVQARQRLLKQMSAIRQARETIVMAFGLAVLQHQADLAASPEAQGLRTSLEQERESVLEFLYTVIEDVLTPAQEVFLDSKSYPWWPDLWYMAGRLARGAGSQNGSASEPSAPAGAAGPANLLSLRRFSAFEMLQDPLLARGCGLQFKRCLASIPVPQNIMDGAATAVPPIAKLRSLTMLEFMAGTYLQPGECGPSGDVKAEPA